MFDGLIVRQWINYGSVNATRVICELVQSDGDAMI